MQMRMAGWSCFLAIKGNIMEENWMERDIENLVIPAACRPHSDGNGRWAKKRGLPRTVGHKQGCVTVEQTVEDAARLGIRYLTVYGFSTENWKRSAEEVGALMQLFRFYLKRLLKIARKNNVRVKMIGDRTRFDSDIIEGINRLEDETAANTGMTFVSQSTTAARDEITRAVRHMMMDCQDGKLVPEDVTEQTVASYLDTAGIPDPDLLIRTSGGSACPIICCGSLPTVRFISRTAVAGFQPATSL